MHCTSPAQLLDNRLSAIRDTGGLRPLCRYFSELEFASSASRHREVPSKGMDKVKFRKFARVPPPPGEGFRP